LDFNDLINSIKNFNGVLRKNDIENITNPLQEVYKLGGKTILPFGDDSSAIDIGNNKVVLVAADGIWSKLIDKDPYWAGYCSILVNVNDIAAMGGKPIAMVNIISINNKEIADKILKGIIDGCKKFNVPMVGGHTHPDAEYTSLDVSIVGIADKDKMITSFDAKVGDKVIVAIDLDGRQHPNFKLNWDTTYLKDAKLVQDQIKIMNTIAKKGLVTGGKDISNPGILGTLEMLLESSKCGAKVNLDKIPKNKNVNWETWLKSYPGAGFILTAEENKIDELKSLLKQFSIEAEIVGDVIPEKKLYLKYKKEEKIVFDQEKNPVLINIK
jgi:putative methanogenesis marker protein 2